MLERTEILLLDVFVSPGVGGDRHIVIVIAAVLAGGSNRIGPREVRGRDVVAHLAIDDGPGSHFVVDEILEALPERVRVAASGKTVLIDGLKVIVELNGRNQLVALVALELHRLVDHQAQSFEQLPLVSVDDDLLASVPRRCGVG